MKRKVKYVRFINAASAPGALVGAPQTLTLKSPSVVSMEVEPGLLVIHTKECEEVLVPFGNINCMIVEQEQVKK